MQKKFEEIDEKVRSDGWAEARRFVQIREFIPYIDAL